MKKHIKHKYIYTFTPGKGMISVFLFCICALCIGLFAAFFISDCEVSMYSDFLKLCCKTELNKETPKKEITLHSEISIKTLMEQSSPVFTESDKAVAVFSLENADMPEVTDAADDKSKDETKNNAGAVVLSEKNIPSDNLSVINQTSYKIDAPALADTDISYKDKTDKSEVLIMHTHACESYSDKYGVGIGPAGTYRTTDTSKNMVKIGSIMSEKLKEKNIKVIHDEKLCDYPSYNSSYKTALGLIDWYTTNKKDIGYVFDIHRDALGDSESVTKLTCTVNGETCAQAMIVCGTDGLGLYHPYWKDNLILALKIQKTLEKKYPGMMRPVNLRKERFNMHMTKGSLIFEIGTNANTLEEAERKIEYLSEGVAETLLKK